MREHQPSWHLHEIGEQALALVHEFWEVHKQEARNPVQRTLVRWSPPPNTCFKGNFDAALFYGSDLLELVLCLGTLQGMALLL